MNSLLLIIFLSLLFWGFYQKWDEKRMDYILHPLRTFSYFMICSAAIIFIYPHVLILFEPTPLSALFFILVIGLTFFLYEILKKLFKGPVLDISHDHAYWKLLDKRFILPKLGEIIFQQTFFVSISLIIIEKFGMGLEVIITISLSFIISHLPLFILQGKQIGKTYLSWSIIGSPIFSIVLLATQSVWYTISLHMFFYTMLSLFVWIISGTRYSGDKTNTKVITKAPKF